MRLSRLVTTRLHGLRGVLEEILFPALQRALIHPADVRAQFRAHARQVFQTDDHVAAADVDIVLEAQRDGLRSRRPRRPSRRRSRFAFTVVLNPPGSTMTCWPALTMPPAIWPLRPRKSCSAWIRRIVRPIDPLHRASGRRVRSQSLAMCTVSRCPSNVRALIPRRVRRRLDDVVAIERADRDELDVLEHVELAAGNPRSRRGFRGSAPRSNRRGPSC